MALKVNYLVALVIVSLFCNVFIASVSAEQDELGMLNGTVADESGGVLPGVTVSAQNTATGLTRAVVSGADGSYTMRLPAGGYEIEAMLPGFQTSTATVTISSSPSSRDFTLAIASLAETVTVTRSEQMLASVPNAVALVTPNEIDFAQRKASMDEALRGIPGLLVQNRRNYGLSGGVGLSIRSPQPKFGLRGLAIVQDGIPITMADGTTEPGNVDLGSVRRIEVIRGPSSVLYGNAAGGVISLFTEIDQTRRLTVRPRHGDQAFSLGYSSKKPFALKDLNASLSCFR